MSQVIKSTRAAITAPAYPSVERRAPSIGEAVVRLRVADLLVGQDKVVCVSGSLPALGSWQTDQMVPLTGGRLFCMGEVRGKGVRT